MSQLPDRDDSFFQMVGDILRETSPVIACCVLLGLGVGLGGAVWVVAKMVSAGATTAAYGGRGRGLDLRIGALIVVGGALGGLIAGLAIGVVIELILEHLFGIKFDAPGKRKRTKRRRKN